jgi:hypothetical protein
MVGMLTSVREEGFGVGCWAMGKVTVSMENAVVTVLAVLYVRAKLMRS